MNIEWFCFIILQSRDLLGNGCKIVKVNESEVSCGKPKIFNPYPANVENMVSS